MSVRQYIKDTAGWGRDMEGNPQYSDEIFFYDEEMDEQITFEVVIEMRCTAPYVPARISGPPEDCYPAEGPEFELETIYIQFAKRQVEIKPEELEQLVGKKRADKLIEAAELYAMENHE